MYHIEWVNTHMVTMSFFSIKRWTMTTSIACISLFIKLHFNANFCSYSCVLLLCFLFIGKTSKQHTAVFFHQSMTKRNQLSSDSERSRFGFSWRRWWWLDQQKKNLLHFIFFYIDGSFIPIIAISSIEMDRAQ